MEHVKISCGPGDPISRQTPDSSGIWKNIQFHIDSVNVSDYSGPFDHWIVFDGVENPSSAYCSGETIFVPWEPEAIKGYSPKFLAQFDRVLSSRTDLCHPNLTNSHPLLPWWIGTTGGHGVKTTTHDYDFFAGTRTSTKEPVVSCICSDKIITEGHRKRLEFVRRVQVEMGERLVVFGSGFKEWTDKWQAISPYQYHLALENSSARDYWTEKVADAFLGDAYLFYWGCPNLSDYFPADSFSNVDRSDPLAAAEMIHRFLDQSDRKRVSEAVSLSKKLVLEEYNLFAEAERLVSALKTGEARRRVVKPERLIDLSAKRRLRNLFNRISRR